MNPSTHDPQAEFQFPFELTDLRFSGFRPREPRYNTLEWSDADIRKLAQGMLDRAFDQLLNAGPTLKGEVWDWIDRVDPEGRSGTISFDACCGLLGWHAEDVRLALYQRFGRDPGDVTAERPELKPHDVVLAEMVDDLGRALDDTMCLVFERSEPFRANLERLASLLGDQPLVSAIHPVHVYRLGELPDHAVEALAASATKLAQVRLEGWMGKPKQGQIRLRDKFYRVCTAQGLGTPWMAL